jgi:hypothetical protein
LYGSKEVDACEGGSVAAVNHLRARPWQITPTHKAQEVPLEHRVTAGVEEQLIE